jgi:hypothetical protein
MHNDMIVFNLNSWKLHTQNVEAPKPIEAGVLLGIDVALNIWIYIKENGKYQLTIIVNDITCLQLTVLRWLREYAEVVE